MKKLNKMELEALSANIFTTIKQEHEDRLKDFHAEHSPEYDKTSKRIHKELSKLSDEAMDFVRSSGINTDLKNLQNVIWHYIKNENASVNFKTQYPEVHRYSYNNVILNALIIAQIDAVDLTDLVDAAKNSLRV